MALGGLRAICSSLFAARGLLGQIETSRPADLAHDPRMIRWQQSVFWAALLLILFLMATWALSRFSARFRTYLLREKGPPTPSDDLWAMHRLPKEVDAPDGPSEDPPPGAPRQ